MALSVAARSRIGLLVVYLFNAHPTRAALEDNALCTSICLAVHRPGGLAAAWRGATHKYAPSPRI